MENQPSTEKRDDPGLRYALGHGRLVRLVLLVLGTIALVFGAFEVSLRTVFVDADMQLIHTVHSIRGIGCSLIVAFLITRFLLREAPPLIVRSSVPHEDYARTTQAEKERSRIQACTRWFVQMRWIAAVVTTTLVLLTVEVVEALPGEVLLPLLSTVLGLALFTLAVSFCIRRGWLTGHLLQIQIYADLLFLNVLLHFSGGIENPLYILAVFHVLLAGILLNRMQCFLVATGAGAMFSLLAWMEWEEFLEHYTLAIVPHGEGIELHTAHEGQYVLTLVCVLFATLFLTAYFVSRLAEQIRADERELAILASRAVAGHRLLENALDTTATGLRVMSRDLVPRLANDRWSQWFGPGLGADPTAENQPVPPRSPAAATLEDHRIRTSEIALPAGKDSPARRNRHFRVTTAPLFGPDGELSEIVEIAREITQQKEEQAQLLRASQLAAIGELASNIAHEINNPISILSAKARLLLSDCPDQIPPKVAEDLGKIVRISDRVARIAQGLLHYARPSSGNKTELDLKDPIGKALDFARQKVGAANIAFHARMEQELPLVSGNAHELEQVFLNLFLNAIAAMPDGGELRVSTCTVGNETNGETHVSATVEDTGPGIDPTIQDRVFEPFFTRKKEGAGTGLGLSICLGIIEGHGGRIELDSEPGRGARFTVCLPVAPVRTD
ncbi:MAG: nitrogen regulation protein NR(II) [Planctomycetota bacterium]